MRRIGYFGLGALMALSIAAIATPGADLDAILQDHEDRITALEAAEVPVTTTTQLPPTTTTSSTTTSTTSTTTTSTVPPSTATLPADGQVTCDLCTLDGGGLTYPVINLNGRQGVTVRNAIVRGDPGGSLQSGTVNARDATGILLENIIVIDSPRSCFSMEGSTGVTIRDSECWNPAHLGFHGGDTKNVLIEGNLVVGSTQRCANGCDGSRSIGWESGGLKMVRSVGLTVINNTFRDGFGPGIWYDIDVNGGLIAGNLVTDQTGEGIYVEISRNVTVRENTVLRSPTGFNSSRMGWLYGSGILVSTSYNVDVVGNVVNGSYHGITVIDQSWRGDVPPGFDPGAYRIIGNVVSNVFKVGAAQDVSRQGVFEGEWTGNVFTNVLRYEWRNVGSTTVPADWNE